jgi:hypothetical protein
MEKVEGDRVDLVLVAFVERSERIAVALAAGLEDLAADLGVTQNAPP